jgi:hypothetical protein
MRAGRETLAWYWRRPGAFPIRLALVLPFVPGPLGLLLMADGALVAIATGRICARAAISSDPRRRFVEMSSRR